MTDEGVVGAGGPDAGERLDASRLDTARLDAVRLDADEPGRRGLRQAVVVIHGIGDQAPMRTLRAFTHGLGFRRLFSSPDRMSGTDDLRRLTEPPTTERDARTDFFEFYWGHHAPKGGYVETIVWALRLLLRREWRGRHGHVAALVLGIQIVVVLLALGLVAATGWLAWAAWHGTPVLLHSTSWLVGAGIILVGAHLLVSGFVRRALADAVRYLHPRPDNVEARRAIRTEGLTLLRRLHDSGHYDRVVVVGHSLGAVIGYDLLRSLWDEARHPDPRVAGDQQALHGFDTAADRLDPPGGVGPRRPTRVELDEYRAAQFDLWQADRADGVPWLVTDFVTVGAPLAYASLLFADPPLPLQGWPGLSLEQKQDLKEYPRCPPIHDEIEPGRFYTRDYRLGAGVRRLRVGHTAAPFGPTRWTNLYLPSRAIVLGDLLAGEIGPEFGPGVHDVPVRVPGRGLVATIRRVFPASHLSYWWSPQEMTHPFTDAADLPMPGERPADCAPALGAALRLGDLFRLTPSRTTPPPDDRSGGASAWTP